MSPTLNRSSEIWHFKYSDVIEICDRMMFIFHPNYHIILYIRSFENGGVQTFHEFHSDSMHSHMYICWHDILLQDLAKEALCHNGNICQSTCTSLLIITQLLLIRYDWGKIKSQCVYNIVSRKQRSVATQNLVNSEYLVCFMAGHAVLISRGPVPIYSILPFLAG